MNLRRIACAFGRHRYNAGFEVVLPDGGGRLPVEICRDCNRVREVGEAR